MLLRMLRQFSAIVTQELAERYAAELAAQPGRLFFPKNVHELGDLEPEAPDGLSIAYVRMAIAKNKTLIAGGAAAAEVDSAVTMLGFHVAQQISRAVLLERRLLERLK